MELTLPIGLPDTSGDDGRRARLAPLRGWAEQAVLDEPDDARALRRLLSASVVALGTHRRNEVHPRLLAHLAPVDLAWIALGTVRLREGDQVYLTVQCPHDDCGDKLDLMLDLGDVDIVGEGESMRLDLSAELACPECARSFAFTFDPATHLLRSIRADARRLRHEVHTLAWHYHWSRSEILELPIAERHAYIELITEQLDDG